MRKIDIYYKGKYWASTTWFRTCKAAKQSFIDRDKKIKPEDVKCHFSNKK